MGNSEIRRPDRLVSPQPAFADGSDLTSLSVSVEPGQIASMLARRCPAGAARPTPRRLDEEAVDFVNDLHGGLPGFTVLSANGSSGWRSRSVPAEGRDVAVRKVWELAPEQDIYVGVGTRRRLPPYKRGGVADVLATRAVTADLDVDGPSHAAHGYGTWTEADRFLGLLPKPTYLINSGGGYQVWWLLDPPLVVGRDGTGEELNRIIARFSAGLAVLRGRPVDTGGLDRSLRLPGTLNHKVDPPYQVRLVSATGARYRAEEVLRAVPDVRGVDSPSESATAASGRRPGLRHPIHRLADDEVFMEELLVGRFGFTIARAHDDGYWVLTLSEHQSQPVGTPAATWRANDAPVLVIHSQSTARHLGLPSGAGQKLTVERLVAHAYFGGDVDAARRAWEASFGGSRSCRS